MTPVPMPTGLMTSAGDTIAYVVGTLGNFAPFLLMISAGLLVIAFLSSKFSLGGHR